MTNHHQLTLDEIIQVKHLSEVTDKNTTHSYTANFYEAALESYRNRHVTLLEVGLGLGGSAALWAEYLNNSKIFMLDTNLHTSAVHLCKSYLNVQLAQADAYNPNIVQHVRPLDIFIEDGANTLETQRMSIEYYLPKMNPGGLFVIEDVQSPDHFDVLLDATPAHLRNCVELVDLRSVKNRYDDLLFVIRIPDTAHQQNGDGYQNLTNPSNKKTLLFCTSYLRDASYANGLRRWLDHHKKCGLYWDQILIMDDHSPMLPNWADVNLTRPGEPTRAPIQLCSFPSRRGNDEPNMHKPGWYRSVAWALNYARENSFDRILHIESDSYAISSKLVNWINNQESGWTSLWCPTYNWPESAIQVINKDRFDIAIDFFSKDWSSNYWGRPMEILIPFDGSEHEMNGDRLGHHDETPVPRNWDFVVQTPHSSTNEDWFWWINKSML